MSLVQVTQISKGRTAQWKPNQMSQVDDPCAIVPYKTIQLHKNTALCGDVMHVSTLPFLITVSRKVKLLIDKWLVNIAEEKMLVSLKKYIPIYDRSGV